MAFKQVSSLEADVTYSLGKTNKKTGKPDPKTAEGYYLGSRQVENKLGTSTIHFLQTPKGNVGLWGSTDMNRKFGSVTPGTMVRVTVAGTRPTPRGDMKLFTVEVDTDNVLEGYTAPQQSAAALLQDDGDDQGTADGSSGADYSDNADEEDLAQAEALLAAERAAKTARVQALLNKNRK